MNKTIIFCFTLAIICSFTNIGTAKTYLSDTTYLTSDKPFTVKLTTDKKTKKSNKNKSKKGGAGRGKR